MKKREIVTEDQERIHRELESLRLEYEDLFLREKDAIRKERLLALEKLEAMVERTLEDVQAERVVALKEIEEEERLLREAVDSRMALLFAAFDRTEIVETLYRYAWERLVLELPKESLS
jgi:hypothetical protein